MPLCIGAEPEASLGDGALLADTGDDVSKYSAFGCVIKYIVDGNQRRSKLFAKLVQQGKPTWLVAAMVMCAGKIGAAGSGEGESSEAGGEFMTFRSFPRKQESGLRSPLS